MGGAMARLFHSVLAADGTTIDTGANGILGTYVHLMLVIQARTTQAVVGSSGNITFNADGGANYDRQNVGATDTTVTGAASAASTAIVIQLMGASGAANTPQAFLGFIPNYAATVFHKTLGSMNGRAEATAANQQSRNEFWKWRSTAAITRITLVAGSGNLLAGSSMSIYGLF